VRFADHDGWFGVPFLAVQDEPAFKSENRLLPSHAMKKRHDSVPPLAATITGHTTICPADSGDLRGCGLAAFGDRNLRRHVLCS